MSSFAARELLNPSRVMEASYDTDTRLAQDLGMDFMGKEVDTGVRFAQARAVLHSLDPRSLSRQRSADCALCAADHDHGGGVQGRRGGWG
jgi:hypothetical protein